MGWKSQFLFYSAAFVLGNLIYDWLLAPTVGRIKPTTYAPPSVCNARGTDNVCTSWTFPDPDSFGAQCEQAGFHVEVRSTTKDGVNFLCAKK